MIKAVIFDMDGLMFDTERLGMHSWQQVFKHHGIDLPDELVLQTIGIDRKKTEQVYINGLGEAARHIDFGQATELRIKLTADHIREHGMPVKPGLRELLAYLKENGIKIAVATSTERQRALFYLESGGALEYLDHVVCGDIIKRGKPEPDIYLKALELLGERAEDCLVLEDSRYGILASHRAHIRVIMIPDLIAPDEETERISYASCKTLSEVIEIIEQENR
jgi:HAD superfamily hydrolase (TIGR01509 family)